MLTLFVSQRQPKGSADPIKSSRIPVNCSGKLRRIQNLEPVVILKRVDIPDGSIPTKEELETLVLTTALVEGGGRPAEYYIKGCGKGYRGMISVYAQRLTAHDIHMFRVSISNLLGKRIT
jgi:hypothetical protein